MKEEWRHGFGFEGEYMVSSTGRIKNKQGKILKGGVTQKGYKNHTLFLNRKLKNTRAHRLVALTFLGNPVNKSFVNHKDGNKLNNNVSNLEWCTAKENTRHAIDNGLFNKTLDNLKKMGEEKRVIKGIDIELCIMWNNLGFSCRKIAKAFKVNPSVVERIVKNGGY